MLQNKNTYGAQNPRTPKFAGLVAAQFPNQSAGKMVPRAGIEPATRGFSDRLQNPLVHLIDRRNPHFAGVSRDVTRYATRPTGAPDDTRLRTQSSGHSQDQDRIMMGRPVNPAYAARDASIVQRYTNQEEDLRDLSLRTGLSRLRVRRVLEKAGVKIRPEARASWSQSSLESTHLATIGGWLFAEQKKRGWTKSEMAVAIGISEPHLGGAYRGAYDWKFSELTRAAELVGMPIDQLMRP